MTWRSLNGEAKNEIDFIFCSHSGIVQDVEVLGKVRCNYHTRVKSPISLHIRWEPKKVVKKKPIKELVIRGEIAEFKISLQNRYSALTQVADLSVQAMNGNLTGIVTECTSEVGDRKVGQDTGKLSEETKDLIQKWQSMKASIPTDRMELAEFSKFLNRPNVSFIS